MTIFRVQHNRNYTTVNNTIAGDDRLSWKAKGIWFYAFSKPDDWQFHLSDIIKQSVDGRDSVKEGLKELKETGYLIRNQSKGEHGQFQKVSYNFYEVPQLLKKSLPRRDFPLTENLPLLSTKTKLSTEKEQQQQRACEKESNAAAVFSNYSNENTKRDPK